MTRKQLFQLICHYEIINKRSGFSIAPVVEVLRTWSHLHRRIQSMNKWYVILIHSYISSTIKALDFSCWHTPIAYVMTSLSILLSGTYTIHCHTGRSHNTSFDMGSLQRKEHAVNIYIRTSIEIYG